MPKKYDNLPENLKRALLEQENENFYNNLQTLSEEQLSDAIQKDLETINKILKSRKNK